VIFGVTAAVALRSLPLGVKARVSWLLAPLTLAAIWGFAQLAAAVPAYRFATWWSALQWAAALAMFWSALQVFSTTRPIRTGAIAFGAVLSLEAILQLFSGTQRIYGIFALGDETVPMGPFRNRDHYCVLMELIIPLALWSGVRNRRRAWIYFTAAGVMYASVIASTSRAGAVIATLEILVVLIAALARRRKSLAVAIGVIVAVGGGVVGWSPLLERFKWQDLFLYRREFFISTVHMVRDSPWFGFGLGSWPWVYPRYAIIDALAVANHAHNDWIEWAADGGIPFAALLGLIALGAFWLSLELPWGIGIVAAFAHAAVDFPFQRPPLLLAALLILALMELEASRPARRSSDRV